MARPYAIGNNALVAALMAPTTNWNDRMRMKDQQLQQQLYLTQEAQTKATAEQQAAAQVANFQQTLQNLPLEKPDQDRVRSWLLKNQKVTAKYLADNYQGSLAKFVAAEGSQWMQHSLNALQQSDEFRTGERNKEQIALAKEAVRKGESLIGELHTVNGKPQYVTATQRMQDYYLGNSPKFDFLGSYKDDDSVVKYFGSQYGPNKYLKTPVPAEEIQNYLLNTNDPAVAQDKYFKKFARGAKVFYKADPFEDKILFDEKRQAFATSQSMKGLARTGIELSNEIKRRKLSGDDGSGSTDPAAYMRKMVLQSTPTGDIQYSNDEESKPFKKLPYSGIDLNSFGGKNGTVKLNALDIFDKESVGALGSLVGAEKVPISKANPTGWRGGNIREGITAKGFNAVDLAGTNHQIVHIDPKIYTNPREIFGQNGQPIPGNNPTGFLKVKVKFADDADAKKAGFTQGYLFDTMTKVGTGVYDKSTREATIFTPIGSIYNSALNQFLGKNAVGQKLSNDNMNPFSFGGDEYNPFSNQDDN